MRELSLARRGGGRYGWRNVLTDMNGTIVNPHALPESADHAEVSCVSCHQMHAAGSIEKKAQRACASCHHADVYECYTCHS